MAGELASEIARTVGRIIADARAVIPGKIKAIKRNAGGELDADFEPGIGKLQGADVSTDGVVASAPVLYPGGGGFGLTWPMAVGDEALGLAADRNTQRWRADRTPGAAHSLERAHNISDSMLLPVTIKSPMDIGDTLKLTGPAGVAIDVASDGAVTVSSNTTPQASTIVIAADGNITVSVGLGKTIDLGGAAVSKATKWTQLDAAMTAFISALVAAGSGPTYAGAGAAQTAWETAIGLASPEAVKVEVE